MVYVCAYNIDTFIGSWTGFCLIVANQCKSPKWWTDVSFLNLQKQKPTTLVRNKYEPVNCRNLINRQIWQSWAEAWPKLMFGGLPGSVLLVQSKWISKQTKRSETSTKENKEMHTRSRFAKIRTMAQRNTPNMPLKLTGTWYCDHKFTCNLLRFAGILWMKFSTSKSMKKSRSKTSQFRQYCKQTCKVCSGQSALSSIQSPKIWTQYFSSKLTVAGIHS